MCTTCPPESRSTVAVAPYSISNRRELRCRCSSSATHPMICAAPHSLRRTKKTAGEPRRRASGCVSIEGVYGTCACPQTPSSIGGWERGTTDRWRLPNPLYFGNRLRTGAADVGESQGLEKPVDSGWKTFNILIAGRVGWRGVERFAWLGLALLVMEKKWGCSRKSGNQTTGPPHRSSPRLGGSPAIRAGLFLSPTL